MGLIWYAGAAIWGVAEATLFFIVPDVLLTFVVVRFGLRQGFILAIVAAAFASLAGLGMWFWARSDPATARHAMLLVPAIGPDLLARAQHEIAQGWPLHLVTGAMTGVPYKLYAVEAGARGIDPLLFIPMSFMARLSRFVLTALLMAFGREFLAKVNRPDWTYAAWALAWFATYAFYFTTRAFA
jgi:membrane protein YqaA with SNARE-associated domain